MLHAGSQVGGSTGVSPVQDEDTGKRLIRSALSATKKEAEGETKKKLKKTKGKKRKEMVKKEKSVDKIIKKKGKSQRPSIQGKNKNRRDILLTIIQGIFEGLKWKNWLIRAQNQFHVI